MTFDQYWSTLIKRWKLIVICFVVIGLGTFIGSKLMTPIYQSAATVRISISAGTSQADISNLLASDQLVQTEAQLATSYQVLSQVASHYPGLTVDQLALNVNAVAASNTQLFEINVTDPSTSRAAALANDIAATLIQQENQVNQQVNAQSQQQIQQDLKQTQKQIDSVSAQLTTLRSAKGKDAQINTLNAQLSALRAHYTQWQSLLAQVELTEAQSGNTL